MTPILIDGIVGARPNLMKIAPLARAIAQDGTFVLRLIHTGQHYDPNLSQVFFSELGIAPPEHNLQVGSGSQTLQTARIMEGYENVLVRSGVPRGVIVVGDVTSTLACSLVAAKLGLPVAHVEAGLRSGDRSMPEEINRIVTDGLADPLFVSDPEGLIHLAREGHAPTSIHLVGNVMIDTLMRELPHASESGILESLGLRPGEYVYLTLHRPSNVDSRDVLMRLIAMFTTLGKELPVVFAVHPRTQKNLETLGIGITGLPGLIAISPLGYRDNLRMIQCAKAVFSDSGGIQEEASQLDVPCLTLRENTERPVTVRLGSCELVGAEPDLIMEAWNRVKRGQWKKATPIPLWDGKSAGRIVQILKESWA